VRPRYLTALLVVLAALLVAGCGSGGEKPKPSIPATASAELDARLSEVERRMEAGGGACTDIAEDSQPAVNDIIASLPSSVDADVRNALQDSFDHLFDLTSSQCDANKGQQTDTNTETTQTQTSTTETQTETTQTDTTPTDTTPTDTTPTDTTPTTPPDNGGGQGGGAQGPGL
jgi:outer membrane murein-binding lipoprotein Lpp